MKSYNKNLFWVVEGPEQGERIPRSYGDLYLLSPRQGFIKNLQILFMVLMPGEKTSYQYHPSEEFFSVLEGAVRARINEELLDLPMGSTLFVGSNCPHQLINYSSDKPAKIILGLSPPRKREEVVYVTED